MLNTEKRNPNSTHIDTMTSMEMVRVIQNENVNAALAVEKALPQIAEAIDHSKANIIAQRVVKSISSFSVEDEVLSFKDVHHGVHFLSFQYSHYNTDLLICQYLFESFLILFYFNALKRPGICRRRPGL